MLRENTRLWRGVTAGGASRQGEIANEPGEEPEANERHVMLQAGLADLGMNPRSSQGTAGWGNSSGGSPGQVSWDLLAAEAPGC